MNTTLHITIPTTDTRIPAEQYGHFAEHLGRCIYDGFWDEKKQDFRYALIAALQKLDIPVLRWPGGCFADTYHWRDGIGAPENRPQTINTVWGWVPETNRFGTHEFFQLCEMLHCKPYLCANMGSGTVQEMADWIHYCTSDFDTTLTRERRANGQQNAWKLPYFGIGNEAWGGGGNMTAAFYANQFRRWQGFAKTYDFTTPMMKIACGPNSDDYAWTETMMQQTDASMMNALSLHFYTVPTEVWEKKGDAVDFPEAEYFGVIRGALKMDKLITNHSAIMDKYDAERKIALVVDEWGAWYDPAEGSNPAFLVQQNTMRDAMLAAMTLHVFHRHTDRVKMANLAQTVNVLQALILTEGDTVICTPTYHVFEMMKAHQNALLLNISGDIGEVDGIPAVSVIASHQDGKLLASLCNPTLQAQTVTLSFPNISDVSARILHHEDYHAHNTADAPQTVTPTDFSANLTQTENVITLTLPPVALVTLQGTLYFDK